MSMLEKLPEDVQRLVVSLPYRVGYFISQCDQSGGSEAADAEEIALRNIVTFYVEDTVKGEFAHEVMYETLKHKAKWPEWKGNIDQVPNECQLVGYNLRELLPQKEIIAFKQNLLEIAIVVAQAYREETGDAASDRLKAFIGNIVRSLQALVGADTEVSREETLNVSDIERIAIMDLAQQLSIEFKF